MSGACSSLISSCERNSKLEQAVEIADSMHSAGLYHSPDLYVKLIEALGRQQQWEKALELFLSMQVSFWNTSHPVLHCSCIDLMQRFCCRMFSNWLSLATLFLD